MIDRSSAASVWVHEALLGDPGEQLRKRCRRGISWFAFPNLACKLSLKQINIMAGMKHLAQEEGIDKFHIGTGNIASI